MLSIASDLTCVYSVAAGTIFGTTDVYVGIANSFAHLKIFALLVRIFRSKVKYVQIWYLGEKMRHCEATSDLLQASAEAESEVK